MSPEAARQDDERRGRWPRNVVLLGGVSFLTDVSSEMLYPIVPLFLTGVLGAPMAVVGLVEGLAEATASLLKLVSGRLADRSRKRLPWVLWGYGLSAASKPLLAAATAWPGVLVARMLDRTGKGLRGPARDAIIADSTAPAIRGRAFGLHRAMDTAGAVLGPLLGMLGLGALGLGYRTLFLLAAIPGAVAVLVALAVREPSHRFPENRDGARSVHMPGPLWRFVAVATVFSIGNSSNAFLLLRARDLGWGETGVIGLYVLYNVVYALGSTPLGTLSDRLGRRTVLAAGFAVAAVVYGGLALWAVPLAAPVFLALYGLHDAATVGTARAYITELAPAEAPATALGLYQMARGLSLLVASLVAGGLWTLAGAPVAFLFSTATSILAAVLLLVWCREAGEQRRRESV